MQFPCKQGLLFYTYQEEISVNVYHLSTKSCLSIEIGFSQHCFSPLFFVLSVHLIAALDTLLGRSRSMLSLATRPCEKKIIGFQFLSKCSVTGFKCSDLARRFFFFFFFFLPFSILLSHMIFLLIYTDKLYHD